MKGVPHAISMGMQCKSCLAMVRSDRRTSGHTLVQVEWVVALRAALRV